MIFEYYGLRKQFMTWDKNQKQKTSYPIKDGCFSQNNANNSFCEYSISKHFSTFILFEYLLIGGTIYIESLFSRGFLELSGVLSLNSASEFSDRTTAEFYFSKKLTWRIWPGTWPGPESRSSRSQWEVSDQNRPMRFPYSRFREVPRIEPNYGLILLLIWYLSFGGKRRHS